MNADASAEWDFWEHLSDEERRENTGGVPHYDATEVAYLVAGMLDVGRDAQIADLGCGTGRLTSEVARTTWASKWTIHAIDISRSMLAETTRRPHVQRVRTHLTDGRLLPISLQALSGAYSVTMMQHIPRLAQIAYVRQVAKVLIPGGRFAFTVALGDIDTFLNHQVEIDDVLNWFDPLMGVVDHFTDSRGWAWFIGHKL